MILAKSPLIPSATFLHFAFTCLTLWEAKKTLLIITEPLFPMDDNSLLLAVATTLTNVATNAIFQGVCVVKYAFTSKSLAITIANMEKCVANVEETF